MLNLMGGRGLELVYIVLYLFYLHLIGTVFSLMSRYDNKYFSNTLQACNVASQIVMGKGFTLISFLHNMLTSENVTYGRFSIFVGNPHTKWFPLHPM